MKTLSIKNPWAYLVAFGVKDVENRSWTTDYRGELLIHASGDPFSWINLSMLPKSFQKRANQALDDEIPYDSLDHDLRRYSDLLTFCSKKMGTEGLFGSEFEKAVNRAVLEKGPPMVSQAIIGSVELVDIVRDSKSCWSEPYQYHWILKNARHFDTPKIGVKGKLRIWNIDF